MIARPQMDSTGTGNGLGVLSWQNSMVEYVASEEPQKSSRAQLAGWMRNIPKLKWKSYPFQEMFQPQMEDITMGAPQIRQFVGLSMLLPR